MKLLKRMNKVKHDNFVFPSGKAGKPLSNMAPPAAPKTDEAHRHYCPRLRSTFRDWTAERTDYPRDVAEMALGHTVSNQVEAAYRRGDLFEKRRHGGLGRVLR